MSGPNNPVPVQREYRIVSLPPDCKYYTLGDVVTISIPDPPPQSMVLHFGGECNDVYADLVQ